MGIHVHNSVKIHSRQNFGTDVTIIRNLGHIFLSSFILLEFLNGK